MDQNGVAKGDAADVGRGIGSQGGAKSAAAGDLGRSREHTRGEYAAMGKTRLDEESSGNVRGLGRWAEAAAS